MQVITQIVKNKYFSPEITLTKLYEKYKEESLNRIVCLKTFKSIFNEYNVSIYILRQNICLKCDQFIVTLKSAADHGGREATEVQRAEHHRNASNAHAQLNTKTLNTAGTHLKPALN